NVLLDQLFLKRDRVGGDDDALLVSDGVIDGRKQIGERLSDARARFHEQVMSFGQRAAHRRGHFELLRAELVSLAEPTRNRAAGGQNVLKGGGHERPDFTLTWWNAREIAISAARTGTPRPRGSPSAPARWRSTVHRLTRLA